MSADLQVNSQAGQIPQKLLEQMVVGSRKLSNYLVATMVTIGGTGFSLASISSYKGQNLLPIGNPSSLVFIPQGLVIGLYGIAASFLSIYLWYLIAINFGAGSNCFNKELGMLSVSRRGFFKIVNVIIPLKEIKAVRLEVRDGLNSRRRITLRMQGRSDLPLTGAGRLQPLNELEKEGAQLARFLDVNLEGL